MSDEPQPKKRHPFLTAIGIALLLMFIVGGTAKWAYDTYGKASLDVMQQYKTRYQEFLDYQKYYDEKKRELEIEAKWDALRALQDEYESKKAAFQEILGWMAKIGVDPKDWMR